MMKPQAEDMATVVKREEQTRSWVIRAPEAEEPEPEKGEDE
jgi:hypothetical protein